MTSWSSNRLPESANLSMKIRRASAGLVSTGGGNAARRQERNPAAWQVYRMENGRLAGACRCHPVRRSIRHGFPKLRRSGQSCSPLVDRARQVGAGRDRHDERRRNGARRALRARISTASGPAHVRHPAPVRFIFGRNGLRSTGSAARTIAAMIRAAAPDFEFTRVERQRRRKVLDDRRARAAPASALSSHRPRGR